jgi:hypothetical protein
MSVSYLTAFSSARIAPLPRKRLLLAALSSNGNIAALDHNVLSLL